MEMSLRLNHLQRAHPVWALHVEPEAQVTQADTGRKWTPGCHLADVTFPLGGRIDVEELPISTFEDILKYIHISHLHLIYARIEFAPKSLSAKHLIEIELSSFASWHLDRRIVQPQTAESFSSSAELKGDAAFT